MKKSLVWILAVLAPLALVACGSSEPAEAPAPVQEQSTAGDEVESLMQDAADALSESADDAGEAVDSAVEKTQDAAEEAGAAASEALSDAEKAVEAAAERAGEKADELMEDAAEVLEPGDEHHEKLVGTNWQVGDFKVEFKSTEDVKISGGPLATLAPDGVDATYSYDDGNIVVNAMGQSKEGTWDGENLVVDGEQGVLLPAS